MSALIHTVATVRPVTNKQNIVQSQMALTANLIINATGTFAAITIVLT